MYAYKEIDLRQTKTGSIVEYISPAKRRKR